MTRIEKALSTNQLMKQIIAAHPDIIIRKVHVFFLPSKVHMMKFQTGVDNKVVQEIYLNPVAILMKTTTGNMKYEELPPIHFKTSRSRHLDSKHTVNTLEIDNDEQTFNGYTFYPTRTQYFTKWQNIYDKLFEEHRNDEQFRFSPSNEDEVDDYEDSILL